MAKPVVVGKRKMLKFEFIGSLEVPDTSNEPGGSVPTKDDVAQYVADSILINGGQFGPGSPFMYTEKIKVDPLPRIGRK